MLTRISCLVNSLMVTAVILLLVGDALRAQDSASVTLAEQLASALESSQLDSIAARDSEGDDRFVAALFFPGLLLVVSARYEVPIYVEEKLAARAYRDVYIDLNTASIAESKILITDTGANGLVGGEPGDNVDVGGNILRFDAAWSEQHAEIDTVYARMLQALINAIP